MVSVARSAPRTRLRMAVAARGAPAKLNYLFAKMEIPLFTLSTHVFPRYHSYVRPSARPEESSATALRIFRFFPEVVPTSGLRYRLPSEMDSLQLLPVPGGPLWLHASGFRCV